MTNNVVRLWLVYETPVACGDERNERRRTHLDLAEMETAELETEGHRARLALCFGIFETAWQREWTEERVAACQRELRGRR